MAKKIFRGDAIDVAQQTYLADPPAEFQTSIRLGISNKTLEFPQWDKQAIISAWNGSAAPEFRVARATNVEGGILFTATTPGVPFEMWATYGDYIAFNESILLIIDQADGALSGTITLEFLGQPLTVSPTVSASDLEDAIEALEGFQAGDIKVELLSSTPQREYKIDFQGRYAGKNIPTSSVISTALTGGNATVNVTALRNYNAHNQRFELAMANTPTGGSHRIKIDALTSEPIPWDANESELQEALDTGFGSGNVFVLDSTSDDDILIGYQIELSGMFSGEQKELVVLNNLQPPKTGTRWELDLSEIGNLNGYVMLKNGHVNLDTEEGSGSQPITFLDGIDAIMARQFGESNFTITETDTDVFAIELSGEYSGTTEQDYSNYEISCHEIGAPIPTPSWSWGKQQAGTPAVPQIQKITIDQKAIDGVYYLNFGSSTTEAINLTDNATIVESKIAAVVGAGNVSVTGSLESGYMLEFTEILGSLPKGIVTNQLNAVSTEVVSTNVTFGTFGEMVDMYRHAITVSIKGNPNSGNWTLWMGSIPVSIPYNATPQEIDTLITTAIDPGGTQPSGLVTVSSWNQSGGTIVVHFSSYRTFYAVKSSMTGPLPDVSVGITRAYAPGKNTIYRFQISNDANNGFIQLHRDSQTTTVYSPTSYIGTGLSALIHGSNDYDFVISLSHSIPGNGGNDPGSQVYDVTFSGASVKWQDYTITSTSYLTSYGSILRNASWELVHIGDDGGEIVTQVIQDPMPPIGQQSLLVISGTPHKGNYRLSINSSETGPIQHNASLAQISTAVELVVGVGNVTSVTSRADGILIDFPPSLGMLTIIPTQVQLSNSTATIETIQHGGELRLIEQRRSAGKSHFDDPLNWKTIGSNVASIPNSGDEIIYESGRTPCLYGLRHRSNFAVESGMIVLESLADFREGQKLMVSSTGNLPTGLDPVEVYTVSSYNRNTKVLALSLSGTPVTVSGTGNGTHTIRLAAQSLAHHALYTSPIGLPKWNSNGYSEFLPTALMIGMDPLGSRKLTIGQGNGSSSGRLRFDFGADAVQIEVHKTSNSAEAGIPAVTVSSKNELCTVDLLSGDLGLGYYEGEEFHFSRIRVNSGKLSYGKIVSAANSEINILGGSIDGRELQFNGSMRIKR